MNSRLSPLLPCLLLSFGLALPGTPRAAPAEAEPAKSADPRIVAQLDQLDYEYELDEDKDFRLVFAVEDDGRSQVAYIRSPVESYGEHKVREIWSPAYVSPTDAFPALIANRLLEDANDKKLGGWVKQGKYAVFVIKIAADADSKALDDALSAAVSAADEMEAELTPGQDEL